MKKALFFAVVALLTLTVAAQQREDMALLTKSAIPESKFTLNTRAWTTNYWTMTIYDIARTAVQHFIFTEDEAEETYERIIPSADLVFPVGIQKEGFDASPIYGPYHRAFGNPFKHLGDFGIGLDGSWKPSFIGFYAGAYFKSQELCFKNGFDLRSYYFQPRAGLMMGQKGVIEAGVYYDMVVGAGGNYTGANKNMLLDGLGLDFSLLYNGEKYRKSMITFMLPLHNFLNENYATGEFNGMKRRVGYIMLTHRISF